MIGELCKRHGVARLEVFGSALRTDFATDTSDIDFLVELIPMEPYERVDAYFGLLEDLRKQLGQHVHLVMAGAVKTDSSQTISNERSSWCMPRDPRAETEMIE